MHDKSFVIALLISTGIHSIFIAPWPDLEFQKMKKPETEIEVTYFKMTKLPEKIEVRQDVEKIVPSKEEVPQPLKKEPREKPKTPEKIEVQKTKEPAPEPISIAKPALPRRRSIRMESTPNLEDNISYLSYSQLVREKIRDYLYRNYKDFMGEGEVAVTFILTSNGTLKDVAILEGLSDSSRPLQNATLKSIKQASPFRAFPKELDLAQISFKITISFKSY